MTTNNLADTKLLASIVMEAEMILSRNDGSHMMHNYVAALKTIKHMHEEGEKIPWLEANEAIQWIRKNDKR